MQRRAQPALCSCQYVCHIEIVHVQRGVITRYRVLELGDECGRVLSPGILQMGFDLWCPHTPAYLDAPLEQPWQGGGEGDAHLVELEAWHVEAQLHVLLWQRRHATRTHL